MSLYTDALDLLGAECDLTDDNMQVLVATDRHEFFRRCAERLASYLDDDDAPEPVGADPRGSVVVPFPSRPRT